MHLGALLAPEELVSEMLAPEMLAPEMLAPETTPCNEGSTRAVPKRARHECRPTIGQRGRTALVRVTHNARWPLRNHFVGR